jgi:hypothetical protein
VVPSFAGDSFARPDRCRPDTMGDALETAVNAFAITFADR